MKRLKKALQIGLGGLLVIAVVLVAAGAWFVRRPWPEVDGQISALGLTAPVEIIRDRSGVPSIYAQNEHDLFFAQGYVHAQDRLWQMELQRRNGSGTLAAIFGEPALGSDRFNRTFGMRRAAEQQWKAIDSDSRAVLEAYAAGVNAYIDSHRNRLPIEFTLGGFQPEPWSPLDSLTWGNVLSFSLGGNYRLELLRATLIASVGEETTRKLFPSYGTEQPIIVPPEAAGFAGFKGARFDRLEAVDAYMGTEPGPVWGSNNWVVHGSRTATGKPLLANDTHLGLALPSIWYQNGLHGGRFNVVGFSFAGIPAVVIGHNERIAWGVTNVNPDVQDLYIEKLNDPQNPTQYEFEGAWHDLDTAQETIEVKGSAPVQLTIRRTGHGPLLNDVISESIKDTEPLAIRWSALESPSLMRAVLMLNQAGDWDAFRQALSNWAAPSQNFVYADVDGNIGYQTPGVIPIHAAGHTGLVPVPGWTGTYEWQGFIPFDELPNVRNPPAGFIATANNKIVGDDYPYELSYDWDVGYRARRITDLLSAKNYMTIDDMRAIQADTLSLPAEKLRPYLLGVQPEGDLQTRALEQVRAWDDRYELDRAGASVYQVWYWFMLKNTLNDELGEELGNTYLAGQYERHGTFQVPLMIDLMARPNDPWFDDRATSQVETRDDIIRRSFGQALDWLRQRYGEDPAQWTWGRLHTLTIGARPYGQVNNPLLKAVFANPPMPARGDNFTINAGSFRYSNPFVMVHGTSQREIIDLSNFDNSLAVQSTGQSGQALHPHRDDLTALWENVEYRPMIFSREQLATQTESTLTLVP